MPLCDAKPTSVDPEGAELAALARLTDLTGQRVLEIGCGDGRLTWRYAGGTQEVLGLDIDEQAIAVARTSTPTELCGRVRFEVASPVERDAPRDHFDVAFFSWSL